MLYQRGKWRIECEPFHPCWGLFIGVGAVSSWACLEIRLGCFWLYVERSPWPMVDVNWGVEKEFVPELKDR